MSEITYLLAGVALGGAIWWWLANQKRVRRFRRRVRERLYL